MSPTLVSLISVSLHFLYDNLYAKTYVNLEKLVIYGTSVAFGNILSDDQKENLDGIIEKTKVALDNATDEILNE